MKTILRVTLVCTLLVMFLPACAGTRVSPTYTPIPMSTPEPTLVEPGLAYGEPCKPPCWRGMIPGKTTKQEADRALEQIRASGWASEVVSSSTGFGVQPSALPSPGGVVLGSFEHDVLTRIRSTVNFYYPIGTLIKQLGEPEVIHTRVGGNPGAKRYSCAGWTPPDYSAAPVPSFPADVLYPQQGLYFLVLVPDSKAGYICPEMKIVAFCYYPPLSLQEALNKDYVANLCNIDALKGLTEQKLVKWHGFGSGY